MISLNAAEHDGEGLAGLLVMAPDCDPEQVAAAWHHLETSARESARVEDLRDALDVARILADLHLDTESLGELSRVDDGALRRVS